MSKFEELAPRYMERLIADFTLTPKRAAGIVGNGGAETSGFEKIREEKPLPQTRRPGLGHFQWTGDRRDQFIAWCKRRFGPDFSDYGDFEANYSMLYRDLVGPYKGVLQAIKDGPDDIRAAAETFCLGFEKPKVANIGPRATWGQKAYDLYMASQQPGPEPAPEPWQPPAETVKELQSVLAHFGLYGGRIDGIAGPKTWAGVERGLAELRAAVQENET